MLPDSHVDHMETEIEAIDDMQLIIIRSSYFLSREVLTRDESANNHLPLRGDYYTEQKHEP